MHIQIFRKVSIITLISILLLVGAGILGYSLYLNQGFNERPFNTKVAMHSFSMGEASTFMDLSGRNVLEYVDGCNFYDFSAKSMQEQGGVDSQGIPRYCYQRGAAHLDGVFLWGDSHAQMLTYGIVKNLPQQYVFHQVARSGCRPTIRTTSDSFCSKTNQFALQEIAALRPAVVVVAQRDAWERDDVEQLRSKLIGLGVNQILFLGKSPEWKADLPKVVLRKYWLNTPRRSLAFLNTDNFGIDLKAKSYVNAGPNSQFVDLNALFCNADGCLVYLGDDPRVGLTSMDGNHLSPIASDYLAKELLVPMITQGIKSRSSSHSTI